MSFPPASPSYFLQPPPAPQALFQEGIGRHEKLKFSRLGSEPEIFCEHCWKNCKKSKVFLSRLPFQTRCIECGSSWTAEQIYEYHTKIMPLAEGLPWRQHLNYDFAVVPKPRGQGGPPPFAPEVRRQASMHGSQGRPELHEPSEQPSTDSDEDKLLDEAKETHAENEARMVELLSQLDGSGYSEHQKRGYLKEVEDIKTTSERIQYDLEKKIRELRGQIEQLQELSSEVSAFVESGPISAAEEKGKELAEIWQKRAEERAKTSASSSKFPAKAPPPTLPQETGAEGSSQTSALSEEEEKVLRELLEKKAAFKHQ